MVQPRENSGSVDAGFVLIRIFFGNRLITENVETSSAVPNTAGITVEKLRVAKMMYWRYTQKNDLLFKTFL